MSEQVIGWLLQQAPVVIVMGLGLYFLWKDNKSIRKEAHKDRLKHKEEMQKLNDDIRLKEVDYIKTLTDVTVLMDKVTEGQDKIQIEFALHKDRMLDKFDDLKNHIKNG
jgi:ABC-type nickel/cobalt efflux system permease component RcnA